jgi:hypothetical protein
VQRDSGGKDVNARMSFKFLAFKSSTPQQSSTRHDAKSAKKNIFLFLGTRQALRPCSGHALRLCASHCVSYSAIEISNIFG